MEGSIACITDNFLFSALILGMKLFCKKSINSVDKRKMECYLNIRKMLALKITEC